MQCYKCHAEIELEGRPTRDATCPKCLAYIRCCRNCRFHDPGAHNQCLEPQADWVKDKEIANFCDFFVAGRQSAQQSTRKEESLKKLDALFKKK